METQNKKIVIMKPVVSEKTLNSYRNMRVATFIVPTNMTKKDIVYNFEKLFGVKPVSIKTSIIKKSKNRRDRKTYRTITRRIEEKKAFIGIGDAKIEIFENIN